MGKTEALSITEAQQLLKLLGRLPMNGIERDAARTVMAAIGLHIARLWALVP